MKASWQIYMVPESQLFISDWGRRCEGSKLFKSCCSWGGLDPRPMAGTEHRISGKPKSISQKFQHGQTMGLYPIRWSWCHWKGKPAGLPRWGNQRIFCSIVCLQPLLACVRQFFLHNCVRCSLCYIFLPFLCRLKRDRNAVMTNGRS